MACLRRVSTAARKLFCAIVRNTVRGPVQGKEAGTTMPVEVLESCGLDVGEFYALAAELSVAGLIEIADEYPLETIRLLEGAAEAAAIAEDCRARGVPLEDVLV